MERIILKLLTYVFIFVIGFLPACADTSVAINSSLGAPQNVTLIQCVKTFNVDYQKLFFLTEAAIVQNNYEINELQSKGGYIVFEIFQYKFLATIFNFGENKAILKLTPCNNNYMFPPIIIKNIFKYIEMNQYKKF